MPKQENALYADLKIVNALGLHARSAAKIAEAARHSVSGIYIEKDGVKADASSIIDLLSLAAMNGSDIRVEIEAEEDAHIMKTIIELVESGFGE